MLVVVVDKESEVELREFSSSHRYSDDIRKTFYTLQGEANVPAANCSKVVATVAKTLFKTNIDEADLPCSSSSVNFSNEAHIIAKHHVVDEINKSQHFVYASDGTSRQKASFLEQHIILPNGQKLSLGFSELACEDSETLLEKCLSAFKEITEIFCLDLNEDLDRDRLFKDIIRKMKCLLSDRASVMKAFDEKLHSFKQSILGSDDEDVSTHFLFCNAHFLLALSSGAEEAIKSIEEQVSMTGTKLGHDAQQAKFSRFVTNSECAALRLIRTASEIFGPRCDEKSGCRQNWLAFCATKNKKSLFTSYRSNRFHNLFLNATAVLHHKDDIVEFLCDFNTHDNLKLQSVLADVKDDKILTNIAVLSFCHVFLTDPYWRLMNSSKSYADFPVYVKKMKQRLLTWISEAGRNCLDPTQASSVFEDFTSNDLFLSVIVNFLKSNFSVYNDFNVSLVKICEKCDVALNRQLGEFLDGGLWGGDIDDKVKSILQTCPLTNVTGERLFGDLDYCLNTRRNASLFYRSTRNMWKHNKTASFLGKQNPSISKRLIKKAIRFGPEFKRRSVEVKKAILKKRIAKCEEHKKKKNDKAIKELERKRAALDAVLGRDMLMVTTKEELDKLYSGPQVLLRLKEQIRVRNLLGGEKIRITGNRKVLYDRLLEHMS